jgi:TolB protein
MRHLPEFSRRAFSLGGCATLLGGLLAHAPSSVAQFRVEIAGVGTTRLPVAIARFRGEESLAQPISGVIRANFERAGYFQVADVQAVIDESQSPSIPDWRARGVDALLTGSVRVLPDGRIEVRYRLWDVVKGVVWGGQSVVVAAGEQRFAAHTVSDEVYKILTADDGIFSTRIAYVSRQSGKYSLWVADADGLNASAAVVSNEPIISPAWAPDGTELAYVSFEGGKAMVFAQNVVTGQRRMIAGFRGSNSAPAWSPGGQNLALTLSRDGGSQLFLVDRGGSLIRRLTRSTAIDTEPVFSSDGQWIYFVSDRGGAPQIYRMLAEGGDAERMTFSGSYNISPALSRDNRWLAYITRDNGAFKLMLQDLTTTSDPIPLTETQDDESPSFAPNNRSIIYATRQLGRGVIMTTSLDGAVKARLSSFGADVREPAWGPIAGPSRRT